MLPTINMLKVEFCSKMLFYLSFKDHFWHMILLFKEGDMTYLIHAIFGVFLVFLKIKNREKPVLTAGNTL